MRRRGLFYVAVAIGLAMGAAFSHFVLVPLARPESHEVCAIEPDPTHLGDFTIQRYKDAEGVRGPIVACP